MRKLNWLLALAVVAITAVGCGDDAKTTTTTTTTTDTASGDTATGDTTTPGDVTATGDTTTPSDVTATTGDKGCLSASDAAFVAGLQADSAAANKFTEDVKNCTLSAASETDQAKATAKIGACIVGKGYKVSETCGGCYGLRGYCTFKNCVANPAEAATANCIASPGGETCTACANKYNCITASEDCKAGK